MEDTWDSVSSQFSLIGEQVQKIKWHMLLIPKLSKLRQADLCEFKISLIFTASSRPSRAI